MSPSRAPSKLDPSVRRPAHRACRVLHEVRDDALDEQCVAADTAGVLRDVDVDVDARPSLPDPVDGGPDEIVEMHGLVPGDQRARFDPRHVEEVRDQLLEAARGRPDVFQHLAHDIEIQVIATEHVRDRRRDRRHRALQLVRGGGQQGAAHVLRRAVQLRLSQLGREAIARHDEGHLVGEGAHDSRLGGRQRGPRAHEDERPERGLAHPQGDVEPPTLDVVRSPAPSP